MAHSVGLINGLLFLNDFQKQNKEKIFTEEQFQLIKSHITHHAHETTDTILQTLFVRSSSLAL